MATTNLCCVSVDSSSLDISYKWNNKICGLYVWLLSLNVMFSGFIHVTVCNSISILWLYNIPLCGYATFCLSVDGQLGCFHLLAIVSNYYNYLCTWFCLNICSVLWILYIGVKFLNYMIICCLTFWGTSKLFSTGGTPFYIPTSNAWVLFLHCIAKILVIFPFNSHCTGCEAVSHHGMILICISL